MGKRFAILIAVAAAAVIAVPAAFAGGEHGRDVTIYRDRSLYHGKVNTATAHCDNHRLVVLFKVRPGADRKLGADQTNIRDHAHWGVRVADAKVQPGDRLYAKVQPKFGCDAILSRTISGF